MSDGPTRSTDMVEVTDCLEAIGVFRIWKNVFFSVLLAGLVVVQVCFWCIHRGWYEKTADVRLVDTNQVSTDAAGVIREVNIAGRMVAKPHRWYAMTKAQLGQTLDLTNGVVLFASWMYALTLLFAMQVTILGRFGGVNHVCRAFYGALLLVLVLLPWQALAAGFPPGAVFTTAELDQALKAPAWLWLYLRFCGPWLLAFILVLRSQGRTRRWAKAILRRLEIL